MSFDALVKQASTRSQSRKLDNYYNGKARLNALGVSLPPEMRVLEMVAPWPKMSVDVLTEVLTVEGFEMADDERTPQLLRRWWQINDLDTVSRLVWTEALVQGQAYFIVGNGTEDVPRITGHAAKGIAMEYDHMGEPREALRRYDMGGKEFAAHYERGVTTYYEKRSLGSWKPVGEPRLTGIDAVPVVPVTNKLRLSDMAGRSEMLEVMALADAGSRSLTNLQVAQELLALPQRWLFADGLDELKDQNGNRLSQLEVYLGRVWTGPGDAKAGQFQGADLSQIINTIKLYGQVVCSITGIPPSMLGISTDNPASAEAMRAAKERLITKAETKQAMFGDPTEQAMRIALDMYPQKDLDVRKLDTLEAQWRDPATPSKSAESANMLQAHAQGVVSAHTARQHLPLTPEQRAYEDSRGSSAEDLKRTVGL